MDSRYSKAIIAGLNKIGFDSKRLRESAGIPVSRIAVILADRGEFTDREIGLIEGATKLTGGQLAASAIESGGGTLTEIIDQWASIASLDSTAKSVESRLSEARRNHRRVLPGRSRKAVPLG